MVHNSIGLSLAVIACSGLMISAQAPAPAKQPAPQTPSAQTTRQSNTTVVGCVYEEKDVPGRSPNIAEKAGVSRGLHPRGDQAIGARRHSGCGRHIRNGTARNDVQTRTRR